VVQHHHHQQHHQHQQHQQVQHGRAANKLAPTAAAMLYNGAWRLFGEPPLPVALGSSAGGEAQLLVIQ
jgi:hypothetical protein